MSLTTLRNLRQQVKVTGLGYAGFEQDAAALQSVHAFFADHIHDRKVNSIDFTPYEGTATLEARARYFTDRDLIP